MRARTSDDRSPAIGPRLTVRRPPDRPGSSHIAIAVAVCLLSGARVVSAQTTYYLHNESSFNFGLLQLKTAPPDTAVVVDLSRDLKGVGPTTDTLREFDTQPGVPGVGGGRAEQHHTDGHAVDEKNILLRDSLPLRRVLHGAEQWRAPVHVVSVQCRRDGGADDHLPPTTLHVLVHDQLSRDDAQHRPFRGDPGVPHDVGPGQQEHERGVGLRRHDKGDERIARGHSESDSTVHHDAQPDLGPGELGRDD